MLSIHKTITHLFVFSLLAAQLPALSMEDAGTAGLEEVLTPGAHADAGGSAPYTGPSHHELKQATNLGTLRGVAEHAQNNYKNDCTPHGDRLKDAAWTGFYLGVTVAVKTVVEYSLPLIVNAGKNSWGYVTGNGTSQALAMRQKFKASLLVIQNLTKEFTDLKSLDPYNAEPFKHMSRAERIQQLTTTHVKNVVDYYETTDIKRTEDDIIADTLLFAETKQLILETCQLSRHSSFAKECLNGLEMMYDQHGKNVARFNGIVDKQDTIEAKVSNEKELETDTVMDAQFANDDIEINKDEPINDEYTPTPQISRSTNPQNPAPIHTQMQQPSYDNNSPQALDDNNSADDENAKDEINDDALPKDEPSSHNLVDQEDTA